MARRSSLYRPRNVHAPDSATPLKILIAPDKFKGTLTAQAAALAIARGWSRVRPQDALESFPISDGGDGFGELLAARLSAEPQRIKTLDAAHRPCRAIWWWEPWTKTAIIESANVIGLAKLPPGEFHPFELDTFGLGAVLRAAARKGARHCLAGIGGSATNDGGFGLARTCGWRFLDSSNEEITQWINLHTLARIQPPGERICFKSLTVAVDVQNPLLGPQGCTRVYGPQKGLQEKDLAFAERRLRCLTRISKRELGRDCARECGAGAAGGLGFGFRCFLNAQLRPGFELFARQTGLARRIATADMVITGEGALDSQTWMGKGTGELGQWCLQRRVPCLALAGNVSVRKLQSCFTQVYSLTNLTTMAQAKARAAEWLERLAIRAAQDW